MKAGTQALASGTKALKANSKAMASGSKALKGNANTLSASAKAVSAGAKAVSAGLEAAGLAPAPTRARRAPLEPGFTKGVVISPLGTRSYRLYKPPGLAPGERVPLLVMLHGCLQTAESFARSTRMNRVAAREGFIVLYPEQARVAHQQRCWNWYDTRSGAAQREADVLLAAIDQVCLLEPVDPTRVAIAGFSAGAGMAALFACRHPNRVAAVAMHAGVAPGLADSTASALAAMRGRYTLAPQFGGRAGAALPPLLVIQGTADHVVAPANARLAADAWAAATGATAAASREVRRGQRYPTTVTDYRKRGRVAVTLCEVEGLGHDWSGGASGTRFGDPAGPDGARMIWAFAARAFARQAASSVR
ncbi:PHB depolymerase family esterase [Schlegelella sp. ID0723]|uniref:PHB depolymerase family esterase n=2 Tax=Piscinibacter koreensis TaxID=2742824 RepID=A0A7Y6NMS9_9BURK|nr:PHB depolymerase family esterase [Schlegelella koreensis]